MEFLVGGLVAVIDPLEIGNQLRHACGSSWRRRGGGLFPAGPCFACAAGKSFLAPRESTPTAAHAAGRSSGCGLHPTTADGRQGSAARRTVHRRRAAEWRCVRDSPPAPSLALSCPTLLPCRSRSRTVDQYCDPAGGAQLRLRSSGARLDRFWPRSRPPAAAQRRSSLTSDRCGVVTLDSRAVVISGHVRRHARSMQAPTKNSLETGGF